MSQFARSAIPDENTSRAAGDNDSASVTNAILALFSKLSASDQVRILQEVTEQVRPIAAPRAGDILRAMVRFLPDRNEWTVVEVKDKVAEEGIQASSKEVYNALGYLTRRGQIKRAGYGRYLVDGIGVVTADVVGVEPGRNDDE